MAGIRSVQAVAGLLIPASGGVAPAQDANEYRLVWSDEFQKPGRPDPARWTYEQGFERNEVLQWYQPENAICRDGMFVIEAWR